MNLYQHLAQEERYMIYQLCEQGFSIRKISRHIDRSPSTVSRELKRNIDNQIYLYFSNYPTKTFLFDNCNLLFSNSVRK